MIRIVIQPWIVMACNSSKPLIMQKMIDSNLFWHALRFGNISKRVKLPSYICQPPYFPQSFPTESGNFLSIPCSYELPSVGLWFPLLLCFSHEITVAYFRGFCIWFGPWHICVNRFVHFDVDQREPEGFVAQWIACPTQTLYWMFSWVEDRVVEYCLSLPGILMKEKSHVDSRIC